MKPDIIAPRKNLQELTTEHCSDERLHERVEAQDLSQILFKNRRIGCLVLNSSERGALLNVSTEQIPDKFILENFSTNQKAACKIVWREHYLIGVRFVSEPKPFPALISKS